VNIQEALQELRIAYPQGGWCLDGTTIRGEIGPKGMTTQLEVVADGERWTCTNSGRLLAVKCTDDHPVKALRGAIEETLALCELLEVAG
jgi:hypothetical protein